MKNCRTTKVTENLVLKAIILFSNPISLDLAAMHTLSYLYWRVIVYWSDFSKEVIRVQICTLCWVMTEFSREKK